MTTFNPPFEATNHLSLALKIKNGKIERIPNRYSEELSRVLIWMLMLEQDKRPSIEDLLNLPQVSLRLRERRLKDNMSKLKKYEDSLNQKDLELSQKEKNIELREKELQDKEERLKELERKLIEREKQINNNTNTNFNNTFGNIPHNNELFTNNPKNKNNINTNSSTNINTQYNTINTSSSVNFPMRKTTSYDNFNYINVNHSKMNTDDHEIFSDRNKPNNNENLFNIYKQNNDEDKDKESNYNYTPSNYINYKGEFNNKDNNNFESSKNSFNNKNSFEGYNQNKISTDISQYLPNNNNNHKGNNDIREYTTINTNGNNININTNVSTNIEANNNKTYNFKFDPSLYRDRESKNNQVEMKTNLNGTLKGSKTNKTLSNTSTNMNLLPTSKNYGNKIEDNINLNTPQHVHSNRMIHTPMSEHRNPYNSNKYSSILTKDRSISPGMKNHLSNNNVNIARKGIKIPR